MTPEEIIDLALGILPDRDLHEFSLWCAEQVRHLMSDERSRRALDVKRRWLDGQATDEELKKAQDAAWAAARAAAWTAVGEATGVAWAAARGAAREAAREAAWAAAWAAARDAAWAAARDAAWAAARDAARDAAWAAAREVAREVARKSQADWLLKNYGSQILHHRMKE